VAEIERVTENADGEEIRVEDVRCQSKESQSQHCGIWSVPEIRKAVWVVISGIRGRI
jgi:hypothetical protein